MSRKLALEELKPGVKCLLEVWHSGVADSIERFCRDRDRKYAKIEVTDQMSMRSERIVVKFLEPDLFTYACGDGGPGHNSCYKMHFYEDAPPAPFSTNTLGDFPKKEAV